MLCLLTLNSITYEKNIILILLDILNSFYKKMSQLSLTLQGAVGVHALQSLIKYFYLYFNKSKNT